MAKTISVAMASHLLGAVTTLATCWKVTRTDGVILGFTDHDEDLSISGVDYLASSGYRRSAIESDDDFSVDNLEVEGVLSDYGLTLEDLRAGVYDFARVQVFLVNWADLTQGSIILRTGTFGEASMTNAGTFVVELRGLINPLAQNFVEIYQPACRASLGDTRCSVNMALYAQSGTVVGVSGDQRAFTSSTLTGGDNYFKYGQVVWSTGLNAGVAMEIKGSDSGTMGIEIFMRMPHLIQVGDTFTIYPGCDQSRETCKVKFDNVYNFQGEPDLPGSDAVLQIPGAK